MAIQLEKLSYTYQAATPLAQQALKDVSFTIKDQSFTAIVGHTGSGKSTLLQHLNGLLKPTSGRLTVNGQVITPATKNKELAKLRQEVGFVFQFPEAQLFEETVLKDIAFAPKNFGATEQEAEKIAREKAQLVNLDESVLERSPFELSGGQMRRVAIAGILAMSPKVLVLDEPEIHLHPEWQLAYAELIVLLQKKFDLTIVITTHSPYFLDAIDVFSAKHEVSDKVNYYLAENDGKVSYLKNVTDHIDAIYKKLSDPMQELENIRSTLR